MGYEINLVDCDQYFLKSDVEQILLEGIYVGMFSSFMNF